ncbi:MAG: Rieske (2Fe-2S) protein [Nakamurella sp.]
MAQPGDPAPGPPANWQAAGEPPGGAASPFPQVQHHPADQFPSPMAPAQATSTQSSRRALLTGTGIAVVAAAAGATWYATAGPTPRATAPGSYQQPASPTGTPTALAQVSQIPEGGGVVLDDQSVVLTRESGEKVHAFSAICTHQGCLVSQVSNGKITCPCHGSTFDANTGAVLGGPAPSPLPAVPVTVTNGTVYSG